jgi:microtubule-associated protein 1
MTSPGEFKMAAEAAVGAGTADNNANMPNFADSALLVVIGEPFTTDHRDLILERITKSLKSWDVETSGCDINTELQAVATAAPTGEDGLAGERFIEHASDQLHTEILVNPYVQTVSNKLRSFLLSTARYRHLVYVGHAIQGSGDWILQDDTFTFSNFAAIGRESDVENAIKQQDPATLVVSTFGEGDWNEEKIAKQNIGKILKVKVNPTEKIEEFNGILQFTAYLSYFIKVRSTKDLLQASDVVGNIRFSRPTLYIFPGREGDSALFGISGFNLLINGGYSRKACFWDFTRHLDRIDAVLMTHLGTDNLFGIGSVLERKAQEAVHPEIGYMYVNAVEKVKHSPNGDSQPENGGSHKPASLLVNLVEEGNRIVENLRHLGQTPSPCIGHMSGQILQPINLYHKVGHGSLDMYVLNPHQDSKDLKDFFSQWNKNVNHFTNVKNKVGDKELSVPLPSMASVSALLVWRPSAQSENITRILFPGSAPQNKVFEGLDRLKTVDIFQHEICSEKGLHAPKSGARKPATGRPAGRASTPKTTTPPPPSRPEPKKSTPSKTPKTTTPPKPEKVSKEEKNTKKAASKKSPSSSAASTKTPTPVTSPGEPSPVAVTPEPIVKEEPMVKAEQVTPAEQEPPAPVKEEPPHQEVEPVPVEPAPVESAPVHALDDLLGGPAPEGQGDLIKPMETQPTALMPEADQVSSPAEEKLTESPEPLPNPAEEIEAPEETSVSEEPVKKLDSDLFGEPVNMNTEQEPSGKSPVPEPVLEPEEDLLEPVKAPAVEAVPEPEVVDEPPQPSEPCLVPEPVAVPETTDLVETAPPADLPSPQVSSTGDKAQLEELGIYDDIEEKDVDTAEATEPEPQLESQGIPAVMTQSMYDDLGIYDDEPESVQSDKKNLEDLGIYDEPEDVQGSAVVPQDVEQSAASQEPEVDQIVFGGAAPEGLPEPHEPVLGPDLVDIAEPVAEKPDILGYEEQSIVPDVAATQETLVSEEDKENVKDITDLQDGTNAHADPSDEGQCASESDSHVIEPSMDLEEESHSLTEDKVESVKEAEPFSDSASDDIQSVEKEDEPVVPEVESPGNRETEAPVSTHELIGVEKDVMEQSDLVKKDPECAEVESPGSRETEEPDSTHELIGDEKDEMEQSDLVKKDPECVELESPGNRENEEPDSTHELIGDEKDEMEQSDLVKKDPECVELESPGSRETEEPDSTRELIGDEKDNMEQSDLVKSDPECVEEDPVEAKKEECLETVPGDVTVPDEGDVLPADDQPIEPEQAALPLQAKLEPTEAEVDSLEQDDDPFARDITPDPTEKMISPESATESEQALALDQDGYPESVDSVEKIPVDSDGMPEKIAQDTEEELIIGEPQCGLDQLQDLQSQIGASLNSFNLVDGPTETKESQPPVTNPFLGVGDDDDIPHSNGLIQPEPQSMNMADQSWAPSVMPHAELRGEDLDRDSLERDEAGEFDPLKTWGKPMGLPAPPPHDSAVADEKKPGSARSQNGPARKTTTPKKADAKKTPTATKAPAKKPASSKPAPKPASNAKPASAGPKKDLKKDPKDIPNGKKESPGKMKNGTARDAPDKAKKNTPAMDKKNEPAKKPASAGLKKTGRPALAATKSESLSSKVSTKPPATKRPGTGASAKSTPAVKSTPPVPVVPFYVDLTYIPHHGDAHFTDATFFRRVRARYYVVSSLNPSPATLNALLEAKQLWENSDAEVTIIPTYDTDTLRHWMGLHRETLNKLKIDVAPSASRCTIQLQDHETSCAAYRLEF